MVPLQIVPAWGYCHCHVPLLSSLLIALGGKGGGKVKKGKTSMVWIMPVYDS